MEKGNQARLFLILAFLLAWTAVWPGFAMAIPVFDGIKFRAGQAKAEYDITGLEGIFVGSTVDQTRAKWDGKFPFIPVFKSSRLWDAINLDFTPFFDFTLARELEIVTAKDAEGATSFATPAEKNDPDAGADAFYQTNLALSTLGAGGGLSVFFGGGKHHYFKVSAGLVAGVAYFDGAINYCTGKSTFNPCENKRFIEDNFGFSKKVGIGTVYSLTLYEFEGASSSLSIYTQELATSPVEFVFDLNQSTRPEGTHKVALDAIYSSIEFVSFTYWF